MNFDNYYDINQVIARYGHVVDLRELYLLGDVFTEDASYEIKFADGSSETQIYRGLQEIVENVFSWPKGFPLQNHANIDKRYLNSHHTTNLEIIQESPEEVQVRSKFFLWGVNISIGEYFDRLVRTPAGWRIASRSCNIRSFKER